MEFFLAKLGFNTPLRHSLHKLHFVDFPVDAVLLVGIQNVFGRGKFRDVLVRTTRLSLMTIEKYIKRAMPAATVPLPYAFIRNMAMPPAD